MSPAGAEAVALGLEVATAGRTDATTRAVAVAVTVAATAGVAVVVSVGVAVEIAGCTGTTEVAIGIVVVVEDGSLTAVVFGDERLPMTIPMATSATTAAAPITNGQGRRAGV